MSIIESLKLRVRDSLSIAGDLLTKMQAIVSYHAPADTHIGYIFDMTNLTCDVAIKLINHDPTSRDLINDMELRDFNKSLIDISQRASAICTSSVWKYGSREAWKYGSMEHENKPEKLKFILLVKLIYS